MFFLEIDGKVRRTFVTVKLAKRTKARILMAYHTLYREGLLNSTPEISLWEKGKLDYPYSDAKRIS
jgi:hypothetical protein